MAPGFMAGLLLRMPENTSSLVMNRVEPRRVPALSAHDGTSLHQPPPSNWSSQLRAPAPEPRCRWYAGGLPSRHTADASMPITTPADGGGTMGTRKRSNANGTYLLPSRRHRGGESCPPSASPGPIPPRSRRRQELRPQRRQQATPIAAAAPCRGAERAEQRGKQKRAELQRRRQARTRKGRAAKSPARPPALS